LVLVGFAGVVGSGSRAGVVIAALSVWLMLLFASPRLALVWTCAAVLFAGSAWQVLGKHLDELPYGIRRSFSYVQEDNLELDELSRGRADQLQTFYTVFAEHPLVGVGPGGLPALGSLSAGRDPSMVSYHVWNSRSDHRRAPSRHRRAGAPHDGGARPPRAGR